MQLWTFLQYGRAFTFSGGQCHVTMLSCEYFSIASTENRAQWSSRCVFYKNRKCFLFFLSIFFLTKMLCLFLVAWSEHTGPCVRVSVCVESVSHKCVLGRRVLACLFQVVWGQHLDIYLLRMNGMATWVLIQHKAKKNQEKNGWGGEKKGKALCNAE